MKAVILQNRGSGDIDTVRTVIGVVVDCFRRAEESCCQVQVVYVDIVETSARLFGVKRRMQYSVLEIRVAAGFSGVIVLLSGV